MLRSRTTRQFWDLFDELPTEIQIRAEKQYELSPRIRLTRLFD